jgi:NitT/TauT family transport system substrate-binding protein
MARLGLRAAIALVAALAVLDAAPACAADKVKFGQLRVPDALFIGMEKGYFAAEGITVEPIFFRSGAELVPSLSTGQIDVAAATPGAALYNAIAQGVNATIVADYFVNDRNNPGGDPNAIVVRKDLVDSGKVKGPQDLKGMTLAITARGQVTDLFAGTFLAKGGLGERDARIVMMPYPDMIAALRGKSIDVAVEVDPYVTIAEQEGLGTRLLGIADVAPRINLGVIMYGERVGKTNRDVGLRFMRVWHKANAFLRQRLTEPGGRQEIARIYQKYLPLEHAETYEKVAIGVGLDSLVVRVEGDYGLRWQLQWYIDHGLVPKAPALETAVDNSFAEAAAKGM